MGKYLPKKRFGQNFLADALIIQQLINTIQPKQSDHLIEIGPGLGAITLPLLPLVNKIDAIELDRDLVPLLTNKTKGIGNLIIHQQDALSLALNQFTEESHSVRVVGNLPYNISTPLLFHLFEQKIFIKDMHFMLQKEVAERLSAEPGSKQYGRLTVMAQYHCEVEVMLTVPPHAFNPAPKVDSAFVRLTPISPPLPANDLKKLESIVKKAFAKRRKTLFNTLKESITKERLLSLNIDPNQRPEQTTIENFVQISNLF